MARAARVPGSGPGRANVRSPRPRAAGAPASTPGADRYASGGGRPGAPPPSGASDCRSGASARCGGGRLNAGGARAPDSLQYVPLLAPCPPPSTISLSLSLPIQSWGDWSVAPRGRPRTKAALSLLSFPSSLWDPGSPRWLLWGQGLGQWDQWMKKHSGAKLKEYPKNPLRNQEK